MVWLDLQGWEWLGMVVMGAVGLVGTIGREVWLVCALILTFLTVTRVG